MRRAPQFLPQLVAREPGAEWMVTEPTASPTGAERGFFIPPPLGRTVECSRLCGARRLLDYTGNRRCGNAAPSGRIRGPRGCRPRGIARLCRHTHPLFTGRASRGPLTTGCEEIIPNGNTTARATRSPTRSIRVRQRATIDSTFRPESRSISSATCRFRLRSSKARRRQSPSGGLPGALRFQTRLLTTDLPNCYLKGGWCTSA